MAFSINTNIGAFKANMYSNLNANASAKTLNALSSGIKSSAGTDASMLSIANQFSSQITGLGEAIQNSNEMIGMLQIADGGLSVINDTMQRVRTLTLQASNDTLSAGDRAIIQKEIDALLQSSDTIAKSTSYNGIALLDGTGGSVANGSFITQSGANRGQSSSVSITDSIASSLLGGSIDITTENGRNSALDSLDSALEKISVNLSNIGSAQNQLISNITNIATAQVNMASVQSQMTDVDFAQASANFSRENLMSQVGSFTQSQANVSALNVTKLLS